MLGKSIIFDVEIIPFGTNMLSAFSDAKYAELLQKELNAKTAQERDDRQLAMYEQEDTDSEFARKLEQEERSDELARELEQEERDELVRYEREKLARELERDELAREQRNNRQFVMREWDGDNRPDDEFEAYLQEFADSTFDESPPSMTQSEDNIMIAFSKVQIECCWKIKFRRMVWDRIKFLVKLTFMPNDIIGIIVIKMINIGCLVELECDACLLEIESETELVTVKCGHSFHTECILRIFETSFDCSMCKRFIG